MEAVQIKRRRVEPPAWTEFRSYTTRCDVTAERLRELLQYDPETGDWTWLVDRINICGRVLIRAGDPAGTWRGDGYHEIMIDRVGYLSHRLAFLYILDRWPPDDVDHINLNRGDNRWSNLREATRCQNRMNQRKYGSRSLPRGVYKHYRKFAAIIGSNTYLGAFDTPEEASAVREQVAREKYGEFYHEP